MKIFPKIINFSLLSISLFTSYAVFADVKTTIPQNTDPQLAKILPQFEQYVTQTQQDWRIPGLAIAIVKDGKILYTKGFGVKTVGSNDPVTPETIFQIGSISKSFTVALTAQLVDQGLLDWNKTVVSYDPDFMLYDPVATRQFTVKDLYAQRSGLPAYAGDSLATLGYDRKYITHALRYIKPVSFFRSEFAYQNILFLSGAELMQKITGKTWEQLLQEKIFTPLNMQHTTASLAAYQSAKNVSSLHYLTKGKVEVLPSTSAGFDSVYIYGPAGGINSNVIDMAQYMIMNLEDGKYQGKQVISANNIEFVHLPQTIMQENWGLWSFYALGWVYNQFYPHDVVWHNGGTSGAKSMLALVPKDKLGIVVLSNLSGNLASDAIAFQFIDMYFNNKQTDDWNQKMHNRNNAAQKDNNVAKSKATIPFTPALPLNSYIGTYENEFFGKINIINKNDQLVVIIGPRKIEIPLAHVDRDTFRIDPKSSLAEEGTPNYIYFHINAHGLAKTLSITMFGENGTFTRVNVNEQ